VGGQADEVDMRGRGWAEEVEGVEEDEVEGDVGRLTAWRLCNVLLLLLLLLVLLLVLFWSSPLSGLPVRSTVNVSTLCEGR
jgi:hypothetical protein